MDTTFSYLTTYPLITIYLIIINLVTMAAYGSDKIAARSDAWRVRESTLLLLALIGGSPGALLAMKLFHHKTRKSGFEIWIALILLLQMILLIYIEAL